MNSFIKNNKQFFSLLLGVLLNSSLHALTFRNEPLSNFVQTGEVLCVMFPENSIAILEMENDNFDIKDNDINKLDNLKEVFEEVMAHRSGSWGGRTLNISSNISDHDSSYFVGRESINLQGKTSLHFTRCLFESPLINITGNEMNFMDSFLINPEVLNIVIDYPGSDYDTIQIIFYDQPENPTVITGEINLKDNQTTKHLIISNVKEVNVKFAWDKSLPKNSNETSQDAATVESNPQDTATVESNPQDTATTESSSTDTAMPKISDKTSQDTATVKSNSSSRSVPSGFVERSLRAMISFSDKYIRPYF